MQNFGLSSRVGQQALNAPSVLSLEEWGAGRGRDALLIEHKSARHTLYVVLLTSCFHSFIHGTMVFEGLLLQRERGMGSVTVNRRAGSGVHLPWFQSSLLVHASLGTPTLSLGFLLYK